MIERMLSQKTNIPTLLKSLDASMLRLRTTSHNIANVTTPEFKRLDVRFEEQLRAALDSGSLKGVTTASGHLPLGRRAVADIRPDVYTPSDPTLPSGVNNVDIDTEMAALAETQLMYNMALKFLRGKYTKLNASIQAKTLPIT